MICGNGCVSFLGSTHHLCLPKGKMGMYHAIECLIIPFSGEIRVAA